MMPSYVLKIASAEVQQHELGSGLSWWVRHQHTEHSQQSGGSACCIPNVPDRCTNDSWWRNYRWRPATALAQLRAVSPPFHILHHRSWLTIMDLDRTHTVGIPDAFSTVLSLYLLLKYKPHFQWNIIRAIISVNKKNQLDVTFCILYFSSASCSTCFGQPCAHHQELTTAWCYRLVLVCAVAAGRLSRPVGR